MFVIHIHSLINIDPVVLPLQARLIRVGDLIPRRLPQPLHVGVPCANLLIRLNNLALLLLLRNVRVIVALLLAVPAVICVTLDVHVLDVMGVGDLAHDGVQRGPVPVHEQVIESRLDTVIRGIGNKDGQHIRVVVSALPSEEKKTSLHYREISEQVRID